jgi:K+-sensing histidine kinase KdpD
MDDLRKNILFALPHELRTPLASILGYAELLIMDADNLRPVQTADMSQAIHRSGKRLSRLVENYLVYAQVELISTNPEQMMALREHRVNARVVIAEVVWELVADAGRDDDLHLSLCDGTLGMADENLRKIVGELVENALKFSQPGSLLSVESQVENGLFQLRIADEGRGMTAKQIRDVGAYMQFDRVLFEQQGLGLGLIISKRLVELHGGTCDIESAVDEGTLLTIRLPL